MGLREFRCFQAGIRARKRGLDRDRNPWLLNHMLDYYNAEWWDKGFDYHG